MKHISTGCKKLDACRKTILPRQKHLLEIILDIHDNQSHPEPIHSRSSQEESARQKYEVIKERVIERHIRELEKEGHGVTYLRTNLETDAVQLTYRDPNYLGAKAGNGYIKDEIYRNIKDYNMKSMLLIIVNKSGFEADLNEIYTRRNPRKRIEDIEPYDIMTDLDNTIKTFTIFGVKVMSF